MKKLENSGELPEFSGKPEDMDSFVTGILKDMSIKEMAYYAVQNFVKEGIVTKSGYQLPPSARGGRDSVCGIYTDFPMTIHLGQSWDRELAKRIGKIIAEERREEIGEENPNTLLYTAVSDVRSNPLCGRFYEGFGEDPYLVSILADSMAAGAAGDDPFYLDAQVALKHFTVYQAEWNREDGSNYIGTRELHEIHFPAFLRAAENRHIAGVMTSYGATNGIPNACSPFLDELNEASPYGLYNISDYGADSYMLKGMGGEPEGTGSPGKGYAVDGRQIAGLMIRSRAYSNNMSKDIVSAEDYENAVKQNLYGLTREDLEQMIRPQIELWVRSGYFNKEAYPFGKNEKVPAKEQAKRQACAMQAACEGLVLLKNTRRVLPLSTQDRILVTGIFADIRTQPMYTVPTPGNAEKAGITPIEALRGKSSRILYAPELSGRIVKLRSRENGKFLCIDGEQFVRADAREEEAAVFRIWDWGQDAYSFTDDVNDTCMTVSENGQVRMEKRNKKAMMPVFSYEKANEGGMSLRTGAIITSPFTQLAEEIPFYRYASQKGWFLAVEKGSGRLVRGHMSGSLSANGCENIIFDEIIVQQAAGFGQYRKEADYTVVFLGEEPRINASEMKDRQDMELGADQIDLAEQAAASFPGKTIVVLRTDFPMAMEKLQKNRNIAAILYCSYGGQYDSEAMAAVLFGEYSPAGRLTASWYKDKGKLPQLKDRTKIDLPYTVDMKAIGLEENELSYWYNNKNRITYPFGFGLSYGKFSYGNLKVVEEGNTLYLEISLTNRGTRESDEVLQVYGAMKNSGYGSHVPKKQLLAFDRIRSVGAGETRRVKLILDTSALKKWDTSTRRYILEEGTYQMFLGKNAQEPVWEWEQYLPGEQLGILDLSERRNLWEISCSSRKVRAAERSRETTAARTGGYFAVEAVGNPKEAGWVMLHNVMCEGWETVEISAANTGLKPAVVKLCCDAPGGRLLAEFKVEPGDDAKYYLDKELTIPVKEPVYRLIRENFREKMKGMSDLFIVMERAGVRVETIRFTSRGCLDNLEGAEQL